jgi:hypothetical protein
MKKIFLPIFLLWAIVSLACEYIVTPEPDAIPTSVSGVVSNGWSAQVTGVGKSDAGDLHIDLAIENETGNWSVMDAVKGKPAVLTTSDGKAANCDTVFVGTGGHSLAPGFQMRGYTGGTKKEPKVQLLYVECKGAAASSGSKLSIGYSYIVGDYDYHITPPSVSGKLNLNLDELAGDVKYPIGTKVDGFIVKTGEKIPAINQFTLTLLDATRTETGLTLKWQDYNPSKYANYVHIGVPPVIGSDGIIYGLYQSPDIADTTITLPKQTAEWTTQVTIPQDVTNLYVLVSVESKQAHYYISHAIAITDK